MKAVGRFFGLFFLEWVLDMAICVVAMFSLGVLMMLIISVFGPNHIDIKNTIFYESINIIGVISFVIIINLSRLWNQLIINMTIRSIVSYFYFNIYLSIFLILYCAQMLPKIRNIKKKELNDLIEKSSVHQAIKSMRLSEGVIYLIDGKESISDQDLHLISLSISNNFK